MLKISAIRDSKEGERDSEERDRDSKERDRDCSFTRIFLIKLCTALVPPLTARRTFPLWGGRAHRRPTPDLPTTPSAPGPCHLTGDAPRIILTPCVRFDAEMGDLSIAAPGGLASGNGNGKSELRMRRKR